VGLPAGIRESEMNEAPHGTSFVRNRTFV
jgi:hypothetical protein